MPDYVIVDRDNEIVAFGDSRVEAQEYLEQFRLQGGEDYRLLQHSKPIEE